MPDIQTNESVSAAKARLREIEEQKEGKTGETATDKPKTKADIIHGVSGKSKKKKFSTKLKEAFFGENIGDGSIAENIFFRIFIPRLKQVLSDMANSAINSALGLDNRTRTVSGGGNVHQANASTYRDRNYMRVNSVSSARRNAISEEVWDHETANEIYSQMMDVLDTFPDQGLTIADAYSIMGFGDRIRSTDRYWGWTSPNGIELVCIDRGNDMWIIDMPPAKALN